MSKQIDERVVSMQFDNKNFEANAQTSLSTIEKLKQKLNFKGATKGLENVSSAAKKIDMSGLGASVGAVSSRFSALEVMGVTALANITNSAVNAGKRIVSALTIDPVKTGLSEYETKINAIQVIKANTRNKNSMEEIEAALASLNTYADRTIYNFAQMTNNVGKFVAQGLDVNKAAKAVEGMANLAGASGASAEDMARATYQMSQALGGIIRKIDWNSLRNANMASVELKNVLMDLARVNDVAIDKMIEKHGTFEDTLEEGWLTGDLFTEAMNIYSDVYSEAELKAKGFTDAQVANFKDLAKTAREATTEVKTFTQLWDVLKETAQSGWTQTWELLIGDFNTAKETLTSLQNFIGGFLNSMSDARNTFIGAVLYPWDAIQKKLDTAGLGKIKKTIESISDLSKTLEYYQQIVHDVWMGNYKNTDTGRYGLLDAAGHDHRVIQDLVNLSDTYYKGQGYKYQLTIEDVQNSQKKFGVAVTESSDKVVEMTEVLENLTDEQLKSAGLTEQEIKLFRALAEEAKRTGVPMQDLIDRMSKVDGRTLALEGLKNIGDVLVGIFKAIGEAWRGIFDPLSIVRTYDLIASFSEFTKKLRLTDSESGKLNENGEKLMRTFKGLFAILDIVATILGGGFKIAFKIVSQLLGVFGFNILDVTAYIGDAIVKFHDWIDSMLDFTGVFEKIAPHIKNFGKWAKETFVNLFKKALPYVKSFGSALKNIFGKISAYVKPAIDAIKNWFSSLGESDDLVYDIITGIANGLVNGAKFIIKALQTLGSKGWSGLKQLFSGGEAEGVGNNIIDGLVRGLRDGAKIVWDAMIELGKTLISKIEDVLGIKSPSRVFMAIGGFIISGLLLGITSSFPEVGNTFKELGSKCMEFLSGIDFGALLAIGTVIGGLFVTNKVADALKNFSEPFSEFGEAMERVSKGAKNWLNAKAFKELAISLAILAGSILILALVPADRLWPAVGAMLAMVAVLGVLMGVIGWISKSKGDIGEALNFGKISLVLLALSGSIMIIAGAMKMLSGIDEKAMDVAIGALIYIVASMVGLVAMTKLAGPDIMSVGLFFLQLSGVMLLIGIFAKTLDNTKPESIELAGMIMLHVSALVAALMVVSKLIGKMGKGSIKTVGDAIYDIAKAIALLAIVAIVLSFVKPERLESGVDAIWEFAGIVSALMVVVRLTGSNKKNNVASAILGVAKAIGIIAVVAILLGYINQDKLQNGIDALWDFVGIIAVLMVISKISSKANIAGVGKSMLAVSGAIAVIALTAVLLGLVNEDTLNRGLGYILVFSAIVGALIAVSKSAKGKFAYLIVISAAVVALAGVVAALSFLDPEKLKGATIAMAIIMVVFTIMAKVLNSLKAGKNWSRVPITLGILAAIVFALGGVLLMLRNVNPGNSIGNALALAILTGALTAIVYAIIRLTSSMKMTKTAIKSLWTFMSILATLSVVLFILGGVLLVMKNVSGPNAIGNAVALGVLVGILSAAVIALSKFPANFDNVFTAAAAMAVLAIALALIAPVLNSFGSMSLGEIIKGLAGVAGVFVVFGLAGAVLGPLAPVIASLAMSIMMFGAGVGLLGVGILAAATGILVLANALKIGGEDLVGFISDLVGLIPSLFTNLGLGIANFAVVIINSAPVLGEAFKTMVLTALSVLKTCIPAVVETAFELIVSVLTSLVTYLPQIVPLLVDIFVLLVNLATEHLPVILESVFSFLGALLRGVADNIGKLIQPVIDLLVALFEGMAAVIGPIFNTVIKPTLMILKDLLVEFFEIIAPYIPDICSLFKELTAIISDAIVKIVETIAPYIPELTNLCETIVNGFVSIVQEISPIIDSIAGLIDTLGTKLTEILYAINDTIDSVGGLIKDALTGIADVVSSVGDTIKESLDGVAGIFDSAFGGMADVIDSVGDGIKKFLDGISGVIDSVGTAALNCGTGFEKLANGVSKIVKLDLVDLAASLTAVAAGMGEIGAHGDSVSKAGNGMKNIADNISKSASQMNSITSSVSNVLRSFSSLPTAVSFSVAGISTSMDLLIKEIGSATSSIISKTYSMSSAMSSMGTSCVTIINSFTADIKSAATELINGMAAGIRAGKSEAISAALEVANSVESIIRDAWEVNSPSKLFYDIALGVGEGMTYAFADSYAYVKRAAGSLGDGVSTGLTDALKPVSDAVNSEVNLEPVIRPVFDLSDIHSGASELNGLFGGRTLAVDTSGVGMASASMAKLQNGNNSHELLSTLKGLRKDMANNPHNSYSIGGISVSSDSDVANAIETLIRAIKVEGRT